MAGKVCKIRMLTSQSGPRVNRVFNQVVNVAAGEMDFAEARRLVKAGSAELVVGSLTERKTRAKAPPETASLEAPENAAEKTGTAPRRRGRPRKKKE